MTPEQVVAVVGAVTALLAAIGALAVQVNNLRRDVDGRLTQLIAATSAASHKEGEMAGRAFMRRLMTPPEDAVEGPASPPPGPAGSAP